MSFILSIDTSTNVCSVALHHNHSLIASSEVLVERSHSKIITSLIEKILKACDLDYAHLNAIAVSKGPGSYTGLRIGVSSAKGLCYGLNIPLIGINTLEAMAFEVNRYNLSGTLVCPMIDARRMEVYCALFDSNNNLKQATQAKILDESSFADILKKEKIIFFGDGSLKAKPLFSKSSNALFVEDVFPSAKNIGYLASTSFVSQNFEDVIYFEPFYLKDFISTKAS
jgi:tRNA threonylcarbamoyladenosine biosynthesis protein TsaB